MKQAEQLELRKKWEARVTAFEESGQTMAQWSKSHDLKPHQLGYWRRKFQSEETEKATNHTYNWVPVEIDNKPPLGPENSLNVRIGKITIEVKPGFDPKLLTDLVRAIETLC